VEAILLLVQADYHSSGFVRQNVTGNATNEVEYLFFTLHLFQLL